MSRTPLDHPGRHWDRRIGQRPVEPARRAQRRQCGGRRRPDAVRTQHLCRLRRAGASRWGKPAEPLRPDGRRLSDGAAGGADLSGAVYAYNHSTSYVQQVLALAQTYASSSPVTTAETGSGDTAGAVAVSWALAQIGTPYVWGGETPGVGFDCSGLVQAAYAVAGVSLPRVAQDQYNTASKLAPGAVLAPGDLVFFGGSPDSIDHVGLYVGVVNGQNVMVDAPHAGAVVRAETFPAQPGAKFGSLSYVAAARPV
jgi:cell wall-associated NlpC family hydrolase